MNYFMELQERIRDLKTAMKEQLVARYLKDNQCRHGIYLIGWYVCPQWDPEDWRNKATPNWSLEEARDHFDSQAGRGFDFR